MLVTIEECSQSWDSFLRFPGTHKGIYPRNKRTYYFCNIKVKLKRKCRLSDISESYLPSQSWPSTDCHKDRHTQTYWDTFMELLSLWAFCIAFFKDMFADNLLSTIITKKHHNKPRCRAHEQLIIYHLISRQGSCEQNIWFDFNYKSTTLVFNLARTKPRCQLKLC